MKIRTGYLIWASALIICHHQQVYSQANKAAKWHSDFQKIYQGVSIYGSFLNLTLLNKSLLPAVIVSAGPDFKKGKLWFSGRLQFGISGTSDTVFSPKDRSSLYNWKRPLLYSGLEGEIAFALWNRPNTRLFLENTISAGVYSNSILPIDAFGYKSFTMRTLFNELGTTFEYQLKPAKNETDSAYCSQPASGSSVKFRVFITQSLLTWPKIQETAIRLIPGFSIGFFTNL
jgi:hypothetical protein